VSLRSNARLSLHHSLRQELLYQCSVRAVRHSCNADSSSSRQRCKPNRAATAHVARRAAVEESLAELARLADTAGLLVVGQSWQKLDATSPRTYIGSGKVSEIVAAVRAECVDTIICDDELSPGQQRNLEKALGNKVCTARVCAAPALYTAHMRCCVALATVLRCKQRLSRRCVPVRTAWRLARGDSSSEWLAVRRCAWQTARPSF
jgi:hypothetical protein